MAIWRVGRAHDNLDCMYEDAAPVDVALAPSVEEFAERYVRHERPVIVRGGVRDWPPSYKWTPEYLKAMCGTRGIKIGVSKNGDYRDYAERLKIGVEPEVAFAEGHRRYLRAGERGTEVSRPPAVAQKVGWCPTRRVAANPVRSPERSSPRTSGWGRPET